MNKKIYVIFIISLFILFLIISKSKNGKIEISQLNYNSSHYRNGVEYLISKSNNEIINNYNSGNRTEMYTFKHWATDQTLALTDYRYIGNLPNNYVYFNCEDENDTSTCEIWRILGIFNVDDGNGKITQKIKLIRGNVLEKDMSINSYNENYWPESELNSFLNGDYYNRTGDAETYGLYESARNLVSNSKFYLGGFKSISGSALYGSTDSFYSQERSNDYYDINHNQRNVNWVGKVALMYPSDYYYAYAKDVDSTCFNDPRAACSSESSWIYDIIGTRNSKNIWFLNPYSIFEAGTYNNSSTTPTGNFVIATATSLKYIEPTVYLDENVLIVSGNGTIEKPYVLQNYNDYLNYDYKAGDRILYNNEVYYVIKNSNKDSLYVTALKEIPLIRKYTDYFEDNVIGKTSFYESKYCYGLSYDINEESGCLVDYDKSKIKKLLNNWVSKEFDDNDLVEVDGYKVRLIQVQELMNNLNFEKVLTTCGLPLYKPTSLTPDFILKDDMNYYWTMDAYDDKSTMYAMGNRVNNNLKVYSAYSVKPVIYLKKKSINDVYIVGDEINYNDSKYYVISNSDANQEYVTIIKDIPLSSKQILEIGFNSNEIGETHFFDCLGNDCEYNYDNSNVKKVIDYWINNNFEEDDLIEIDNYKGRLLSLDDLFLNWNLIYSNGNYTFLDDDAPAWLRNYDYYLMDVFEGKRLFHFDYNVEIDFVSNNNPYAIKPVINLKKSAIGHVNEKVINTDNNEKTYECKPKYKKEIKYNYNKFKIGDEVIYKDEKYYVIEDSSTDSSYVVLLKDDFLIDDNINNNLMLKQYYSSDGCTSKSNLNDCKTGFNVSNIKTILNTWVSDNNMDNDLVDVEGYKVRLLKTDELFENLGYDFKRGISQTSSYFVTDDVPKWIYDKQVKYWTMSSIIDDNSRICIVNENGVVGYDEFILDSHDKSYVFNSYAIRPVINLNKCAIDGGCEIEELNIFDGCTEDDITIVDTPNTLFNLFNILIIISVSLILVGLGILGYNYYKSREEGK